MPVSRSTATLRCSMAMSYVSAGRRAARRMAWGAGASAPSSGPNPNVTLIGEAMQRSGDIRLPLIGKLPLQQQVRILLFALVGFLALATGAGVLSAGAPTGVRLNTVGSGTVTYNAAGRRPRVTSGPRSRWWPMRSARASGGPPPR